VWHMKIVACWERGERSGVGRWRFGVLGSEGGRGEDIESESKKRKGARTDAIEIHAGSSRRGSSEPPER
jgi:hypothetical protein